MDHFATLIGNAVIDTIVGIALVLSMIYASVKWEWFARTVKIAFLIGWGAMVAGGPIAAIALEWSNGAPVATWIAAALFLTIGTVTFRYLGFPELVRTLKRQDD